MKSTRIQPEQTDGTLKIAGFEDFLMGQSAAQNGSPLGQSNVGTTISGGGIFRRNERYTDFAGFAQDDIKLTPRLTVNAGLRYEIFGSTTEIQGQADELRSGSCHQGTVPASGTFKGFTVPSNFPGTPPACAEILCRDCGRLLMGTFLRGWDLSGR